MHQRHLTLSVLLTCSLVLTACGGGSDPTSSGTSSGSHSGGHSAGKAETATRANDADRAFLAGMGPHHQQAVEMSELVLAADPPAEVAAIARQIRDAQAPEIEQIDQMLTDLGGAGETADGGGHAAHGGSMGAQDLAALRGATGVEAARVYLEGMIEHHEGAVEAAEAELADGKHPPARDLAKSIVQAQSAEVTRMRALLTRL